MMCEEVKWLAALCGEGTRGSGHGRTAAVRELTNLTALPRPTATTLRLTQANKLAANTTSG